MEHFYQNIHGWFDFENIYRAAVEIAPADRESLFVELGSWVGRSAAFMCVEIANSRKRISFDCVDSWEGTGAPGEYDAVNHIIEQGLFETFKKNMAPAEGLFNFRRGMTVEVAKQYNDATIDFLFIDAGHTYDAITADLEAWLPKIRPGGLIGGHDFFSAPYGVGRAVQELVPGFHTNSNSWYARTDDETVEPFKALL